MGVLLKVPCFLYPVTYWSQGTVLILVLLLSVLRCITFQVSVSPLCCSTCPFWTPPPPAFPLLPGRDAWPSASGCSSRGSGRCRRGWRTRGTQGAKRSGKSCTSCLKCEIKENAGLGVVDYSSADTRQGHPQSRVFLLCLRALNPVWSQEMKAANTSGSKCVQLWCRCEKAELERAAAVSPPWTGAFVPSGTPKLCSMWRV